MGKAHFWRVDEARVEVLVNRSCGSMTGVIKTSVSYSISRVPPRAPSFLHPLHRHVPRTLHTVCSVLGLGIDVPVSSQSRSPPLVVVPSHLPTIPLPARRLLALGRAKRRRPYSFSP